MRTASRVRAQVLGITAVLLAVAAIPAARGAADALPSAEQVLAKYQRFLGGSAALAKVTERTVRSRRIEFGDNPSDEDMLRVSGRPLFSIMRRSALDGTLLGYTNGCDEAGGWSGYQKPGDKGAAVSGVASTDGICEQEIYYYGYLPFELERLVKNVQRLEVKAATLIVPTDPGPWGRLAGGRSGDRVPAGPRRAYVVLSTPVRGTDTYAWLYFDVETGALLRRAFAGKGPVPVPPGANPNYTDFIQYRDIGDGTRAPFQFVSIGPHSETHGVHFSIIDNESVGAEAYRRPKDILREDKGL